MMWRSIALAAGAAAGLLLAAHEVSPPDALPAAAPPGVFSAGRAMADVRQIARAPHPVGSAEDARVRDYLVGRMNALRLSPAIQRAWSVEEFTRGDSVVFSGGEVVNIVGVLPGRDRRAPAVALMAHYDSRAGSPGAADDAAGAASALEIARILAAEGPPARDVVVLLTDGEEAGLLGARAFFAEHPLARHIGLVLNMEARGGGGRTSMFQTGPENGPLIDLYRRAVDDPFSNSLAVFVYRVMPNDTDMTVSLASGIPGLNFAFIGTEFDYHAPTSTPDNLDQRSMQHMGDQVLAVARQVAADSELPGRGPDATYGEILGPWLVAYPAWGGWIVLAGAALLLAVAAVRARRAGALRWPDVARGAAAALYMLLAGALLLGLARRATGVGFDPGESRALLARFDLWTLTLVALSLATLVSVPVLLARERARLGGALAALAAGALWFLAGGMGDVGLVLGVVAALIAALGFGRGAQVSGAWAGCLLIAFAAAVALQIAAPTAAYLVAWPLLLASAAASATALATAARPWAWILLGVALAAGLGWVGGYFATTVEALGIVEVLAVFPWLAATLAWPLVQPATFRRAHLAPGAVLVALAAAGVVAIRMGEPWSERHPRLVEPIYVVDADAHSAWRVATTPDLDPWSRSVLQQQGEIGLRPMGPPFDMKVHAAPAPLVPAPPARVSVTTTPAGAGARVEIRAVPTADAAMLAVDIKTTVDATEITLNGRPLRDRLAKDRWTHIRWHAGQDGFTLAFRAPGPGAVEVRHAQITRTWPASQPLPPLPPDTALWSLGGSTVATAAATQKW
jgi:hypothetical protein